MTVIVGILSAAANVEKRQWIRSTWFKYGGSWRGMFITAALSDNSDGVLRKLEAEQSQFGDLLIVDLQEHYSLLPLKASTLIHFSDIINVPYMFKTDDDAYVNIPLLMRTLEISPRTGLYGGFIMRDRKPERNPCLWQVSREIWPWDSYPPFAAGTGYILSNDVTQCASRRFDNSRYNPNEDVYVSALVEDCNFNATSIPYIYCCDEGGDGKQFFDTDQQMWYPFTKVLIKHYVRTYKEMQNYYKQFRKLENEPMAKSLVDFVAEETDRKFLYYSHMHDSRLTIRLGIRKVMAQYTNYDAEHMNRLVKAAKAYYGGVRDQMDYETAASIVAECVNTILAA